MSRNMIEAAQHTHTLLPLMGPCTSKTDSTPEQQRQLDQLDPQQEEVTWSPKPAIPGSGEAGCNLEEEGEEEEAVAPRASLMFFNRSICTIRVSVYTQAGKVLVRDFQMQPWDSHCDPLLENEEVSFPADHEEVRVCAFYLNARGYQLFMNDVYSIVGKVRAERMVFTIKLYTSDVEARIKTKGG